jgi:hypothetical protein
MPVNLALSQVEGPEVAYAQTWLAERFQNEAQGLKQTIRVRERPRTGESGLGLALELSLAGDLRPELSPGHASLELFHGGGSPVLTYELLGAWDANEKALAARLELDTGTLMDPSPRLTLQVDDLEAAYPVTLDLLLRSPGAGPDWVLTLLQGNAGFGGSVDSAGDVNHDGYDDIMVGCPKYTAGELQ